MANKTLIQNLNKIQNMIYLVEYDQLTDYLKGVRDMINLLNDEEEPTEYIANEIKEVVKKVYGHVEVSK